MATATMKAIRFHGFGGPEVLVYEDAPKPELRSGEVSVRVHAIGLNPPDWYLRDGYRMLPPEWQPQVALPAIPGTDISGVVESIAGDVENVSIGDPVYAMVRFPAASQGAAEPTPSMSACRPQRSPPSLWASTMCTPPEHRCRC
jgi:NADPH:quinone reductase-like Zn-dependent oxidoreductase